MGQSSMFLTFRTICNFRGRTSALGRVGGGKGGIPGCSIPVYYEAFLKTQPAHNNEKRFISSNRVFFSSINHLTVGSFSINSFLNSRLQKYSITTIHTMKNMIFSFIWYSACQHKCPLFIFYISMLMLGIS